MTDFSSNKRDDLSKSPDFLRPALIQEHNISYQELKNEYVKALNYIEIVTLERNNLMNTMKTVSSRRPDLNSASTNSRSLTSSKSSSQLKGVIMSQPMTDKKYIQLDQENRELKRLIAETKKPLRDLEDEKKIVALEREVDDLRKNLDDKSERINFMQKEGRFHQERIVEMYQLEKANKQLKGEIQYLNDELDASKRKFKEVEEKNSRLVANDPNSSPFAQETNQSLMKSSGQLLSTVNTFASNHFVRTCFEERFSGAVEVHRLLNTKDYASLLLKTYKYVNDLLFNLNTPSMPNIAPLSARGQNTDRFNDSLNRSGVRAQQSSPTHKRKASAGTERPNTPGSNLNISLASNATHNNNRSRANVQPQTSFQNNNSVQNKNNNSIVHNNENSSSVIYKEKTPTSSKAHHSRALSQNIPQLNTCETVMYETNSALNPKPLNPPRSTLLEDSAPGGSAFESITMFDATKSSPAIHNQDRLRLKNLLSTTSQASRDFRMECNNELKDRKVKAVDVSNSGVGRSSLNPDPLAEKERLLKERERHLNDMERELRERDRELLERSREVAERRNNNTPHSLHHQNMSSPTNHNTTKDYMTFQKDPSNTPSNYNSNQNTSKITNETRHKSNKSAINLHIPLNQALNQTAELNQGPPLDPRDLESRFEESTYKHENEKSVRFTPMARDSNTSYAQKQAVMDQSGAEDYRRDYIRGGSIGGDSVKNESVRFETGERFETRGFADLPSVRERDEVTKYKRLEALDGSPLRRMNSRNKSMSSNYDQQQQQQQQQQALDTRGTGKLNYIRDRDRVQPWELQERDYQPTISTARELPSERRYLDEPSCHHQAQNQNQGLPQPQQAERIDDYNNSRIQHADNFSPNSNADYYAQNRNHHREDYPEEAEHIADQQNNHITFENQDEEDYQEDLIQYANQEYNNDNDYDSRNGNSRMYSSRQRGNSPPADYPTFRVAFGRTESKAKFGSNQDQNGSVLDLQKKKRVNHLHSTYDVIKGQEARFEAIRNGERRYEFSPTKGMNRVASTHQIQNLGSPTSSGISRTPSMRLMEN